jgi:CRISPR/Cas system CMR subunit Cmr6 (Cas7 group RAMP superfamily)
MAQEFSRVDKLKEEISAMFQEYKRIIRSSTPFGQATITALIIGVADVIVTFTDAMWLAGDMSMNIHWYHPYIAGGLITGLVMMIWSFLYLHTCVKQFHKKQVRKEKLAKSKAQASLATHTPTHCDRRVKVKALARA